MPLKPERAYPYLDNERRKIAEKIASIIERFIFQVAHDLYGNNIKLERFTEIRWNVYIKKSFFESLISKEENSLFSIEIVNIQASEIGLYVEFTRATIEQWDGFDENENSREKVIQHCKQISADTGLVVALRMGKGRYSFLSYIRP